jgi:hypothetical protein
VATRLDEAGLWVEALVRVGHWPVSSEARQDASERALGR